eukprot:2686548-Prymnesium_polylepis.1
MTGRVHAEKFSTESARSSPGVALRSGMRNDGRFSLTPNSKYGRIVFSRVLARSFSAATSGDAERWCHHPSSPMSSSGSGMVSSRSTGSKVIAPPWSKQSQSSTHR